MKAVAQRDAGHSEGEERADFERRAPILDARRLADASDVHGRHGGDHGDRGQLVRGRRERNELTQIVCERHRERRGAAAVDRQEQDRKSTRLNSSHSQISYAVFCLKKKKKKIQTCTSYIL